MLARIVRLAAIRNRRDARRPLLHPEDVAQIAEAVVRRLAERLDPAPGRRFVGAAALARLLGVERDWICQIDAGVDLRDERTRRVQPLGLSSLAKIIGTLAAILDEAIEDDHEPRRRADLTPARRRDPGEAAQAASAKREASGLLPPPALGEKAEPEVA